MWNGSPSFPATFGVLYRDDDVENKLDDELPPEVFATSASMTLRLGIKVEDGQ